jgi:hypothetical protein
MFVEVQGGIELQTSTLLVSEILEAGRAIAKGCKYLSQVAPTTNSHLELESLLTQMSDVKRAYCQNLSNNDLD